MVQACRLGIAVFCLTIALTAKGPTGLSSVDLPFQNNAPKADCVVIGRIVDSGGSPLERATVRLIGSDGPSERIAVTDSSGQFRLAGLSAGNFAISAAKEGYVAAFYGSPRPGRGPAIPIALAPGQSMTASMTLVRAASVSGTITGEFGQPLPQVQVQVRSLSGHDPAATQTATTDGRGAFNVVGLAPGDYVIVGIPPSSISGEGSLVTDDQVKWALQELARGRAGSVATQQSPVPPPMGATVSYAPWFFPGTPFIDSASRISLGPGEERDITLGIRYITAGTISGSVATSRGGPGSTTLFLVPRNSATSAGVGPDLGPARRVQVSDDGRFTVSGIAPGISTLVDRWDPDIASYVSGPSAVTLWGEHEVPMGGLDVRDVVVTLYPGARLAGTVRFESKTGSMPPQSNSVRVMLSPTRNVPTALMGSLLASVSQAGGFAFPSLPPGSYAAEVTPATVPGTNGAQWTLKSVVAAGREITDTYLEVARGDDVPDLVLTLTDQRGEVSGVLLDVANRPTSAFSVVVFSASSAFWTRGSRRVRAVQPATDGTFRIAGLPAGDYYVVAAADLDSDMLADPQSLEHLRQSAFPLSLLDGEKRLLNLKIGGR